MPRARAVLGADGSFSLEDARTALYAWLWARSAFGTVVWGDETGEALSPEHIATLSWLDLSGETGAPPPSGFRCLPRCGGSLAATWASRPAAGD